MMKNLSFFILLLCNCINAVIAVNDPIYPLKAIINFLLKKKEYDPACYQGEEFK